MQIPALKIGMKANREGFKETNKNNLTKKKLKKGKKQNKNTHTHTQNGLIMEEKICTSCKMLT